MYGCRRTNLSLILIVVAFLVSTSEVIAEQNTEELAARIVAKLHYDKGLEYLDAEDYATAERELSLAILSAADFTNAFLARAQARYLQEKYQLAIEDFDRYLSEVSDDPSTLFLRGLAKSLVVPENVAGACADMLAAQDMGMDLSELNGVEYYCSGQAGWADR